MDCFYIGLSQKALHIASHSLTHSYTNGGVSHARRLPACPAGVRYKLCEIFIFFLFIFLVNSKTLNMFSYY